MATGGGIILAEANRQFMRENGVVIYLQVPVSALIERLEAYPKTEQRPTLTGKPVRDEVGEVLAQREALDDVVGHILATLQNVFAPQEAQCVEAARE